MKKTRYAICVLLLLSSFLLVGCPPFAVVINNPIDGNNFEVGEEISFACSATDLTDGTLTGDSLVWTSSRDGEIGTGSEFTRNDLSEGTHEITLSATNSLGKMGTYSITITVGEPTTPPSTTTTTILEVGEVWSITTELCGECDVWEGRCVGYHEFHSVTREASSIPGETLIYGERCVTTTTQECESSRPGCCIFYVLEGTINDVSGDFNFTMTGDTGVRVGDFVSKMYAFYEFEVTEYPPLADFAGNYTVLFTREDTNGGIPVVDIECEESGDFSVLIIPMNP